MNKKRELVKARHLTLKHLLTLAFISSTVRTRKLTAGIFDIKAGNFKKMGYKKLVKISADASNYVAQLTKDRRMVLAMPRQTGKSTMRTAIIGSINHFSFIKNTFHRLGVYKNESPRLIRNRKRLIHRANTKSLKNHVRDFSFTVDVNLL